MEITIDAKNKSFGRVATEAAMNLMEKTKAGYAPNLAPKTRVKIINLSEAKATGKKLEQKIYTRYSGYPGGLKSTTLKKSLEKNPAAAFKNMVRGMLPKNKLRKIMLKNLIIEK